MKKNNGLYDKIPVIKSYIYISQENNGAILIDVSRGKVFLLNKVAFNILNMCNGTKTVKEMIEIISKNFILSNAEKIVADSLKMLKKNDIIDFINYKDPKAIRKLKFIGKYNHIRNNLKTVIISVTNKCNLRCLHCFVNGGESYEKELTTTDLQRIFDQLKKLNTKEIILTGGEPFLRKDFKDIIKIASEYDFENIMVFSNGTLINNDTAKFLKEFNVKIQISLYGASKETYERFTGSDKAYDMLIKSLNYLAKYKVSTIISLNITRINVYEVRDMIRLGFNFNIKKFRIAGIIPLGRGEKFFKLLNLQKEDKKRIISYCINYINEKGGTVLVPDIVNISFNRIRGGLACPAARTLCFINANGDVYPCPYLLDRTTLAGNVRENEFIDIWNNAKIFETLRNFNVNTIEPCYKCPLKSICQGGCRAESLIKYGNLENPVCPFEK